MTDTRIRDRILIPIVLLGLVFMAGRAVSGDPIPQGTDFRTATFYVA